MSLFRKKSIEHMLAGAQRAGLKKTLGAIDLTFLGVGAIIGTGIFVLTGTGAVQAGPALMVAFIVAAIACGSRRLPTPSFHRPFRSRVRSIRIPMRRLANWPRGSSAGT
jgi:basic amino acid/polyamine antiporter, APA family